MLALEQPARVATVSSPASSDAAVLGVVIGLLALSSLLLVAAAVPPAVLPWRALAVRFDQRRATIAIYGLVVFFVAAVTYAMSAFSA